MKIVVAYSRVHISKLVKLLLLKLLCHKVEQSIESRIILWSTSDVNLGTIVCDFNGRMIMLQGHTYTWLDQLKCQGNTLWEGISKILIHLCLWLKFIFKMGDSFFYLIMKFHQYIYFFLLEKMALIWIICDSDFN